MAILDDLRQYAASQKQDPMAMLAMMKLMSSPQATQQPPMQLAGNYITSGGLILTPREQQQIPDGYQPPQQPQAAQPAQPTKYVDPAQERAYLQQRMEEDKQRLKELSKQTQRPKQTYYGD